MTTELNVSRLHRDAQMLVAGALDLGWKARNWKQGVILTSPVDAHINVMLDGKGQMNDRKRETISKKLFRYGDPAKAAAMDELRERIKAGLRPDISNSMITQIVNPDSDDPEPTVKRDTLQVPDRPAPTIVSETPWMARHGSSDSEGRHYESAAVIERKWSDGTVDYRCTWPGCDYARPQPRSVARHYGSSRDHSIPAAPGQEVRGPAYEWTPRSQAKADRLASEIRKALQAMPAGLTDDERAQKVAEYIIREREKRREVHEGDTELGTGSSEPLTAEQIVERIRRMVDDGSYMERITETERLREQLARSEANCAAIVATAQVGAAELERVKVQLQEAQAEWDALRDIIDNRKVVS